MLEMKDFPSPVIITYNIDGSTGRPGDYLILAIMPKLLNDIRIPVCNL